MNGYSLEVQQRVIEEKKEKWEEGKKKMGEGRKKEGRKEGGKKGGNLTPSVKTQWPPFPPSDRTHGSPKSTRTSYSCQVIPLRVAFLLSLSLVGCSPQGREELDTIERLHFLFSLSCIGEGNGNPLQCSCLENPRDRGAWWGAVFGVAQSRTRLKRLSRI